MSRLKSDLTHTPQLWLFHTGECTSSDFSPPPAAWFNPSERTRFSQFTSARAKRQFLQSRLLIRQALSYNFSLPIDYWDIDSVPGSTPKINNAAYELNISLSHSHDWIAVALGSDRLGVDIEKIKPRNLTEAARVFMTRAELDSFLSSPSETGFYRAWCLKEACYKAFPDRQQQRALHQIDTLELINEPCSIVELGNSDYLLIFYLPQHIDAVSCFLLGSDGKNWQRKNIQQSPSLNFFHISSSELNGSI